MVAADGSADTTQGDTTGDGTTTDAADAKITPDTADGADGSSKDAASADGDTDAMAANDATGTDSAGSDTASPDAASPAATGPDATGPDATSPDATSPDATAPDAGTPDAASLDAGAADAGSADAGAVDAGPDVVAGPCGGAKDGQACDDGDACTVADACKSGACQPGKAKVCDDGEACTTDACDKAKGCTTAASKDGQACDDANVCTSADACKAGACTPGKAKICDDGKTCTADSCDKVKGCLHVAAKDGGACDDGDLCSSADVCKAGACQAGKAVDCKDANACTTDSCDKTKGCVHASAKDGSACDDGSACTQGDGCKAGVCKAGPAQIFETTLPPNSALRAVATRPGGGWLATGDRDKAGGQKREVILVAFGSGGTADWTVAVADGDKAHGVGVLALAGGDIVVAATLESPVPSAALIRLDAKGKNATQYGLFMSKYIKPSLAALASDGAGGAFFAGSAVSNDVPNTGPDGWLVRTDGTLKTTWQHTWGDEGSDAFNGVTEISGGAAAVGSNQIKGVMHGWAVRVDSGGKVLWQKSWPGKGVGGLVAATPSSQGGLVLAGTSGVKVAEAPWLLGVDSKGALLWQQHLSKAADGGALALAMGADGSIALGGGVPNAAWLARTSATGELLWQLSWSGGAGDRVAAMLPLAKNALLVVGQRTKAGKTSGMLVRTDAWGHADCGAAGKCGDPALKGCEDGKPCTGDLCDGKAGCSHIPLSAGLPCGGGNFCYSGACEAPKCKSGKDCSDGNPCTDDVCDLVKAACSNPANTLPCDDGKACTVASVCAGGKCTTGKDKLFKKPLVQDASRALHRGLATPDGNLQWIGRANLAGKNSKGMVALTDRLGKNLGEQLYGGAGNYSFNDGVLLANGGGVYCGHAPDTKAAGNDTAWLVRTDAAQKVVWQNAYSDGKHSRCSRMRRRSDGDMYLFGGTQAAFNNGNSHNMIVIRVDSAGKLKWSLEIDSGAGSLDYANDIALAPDGGFVTCSQSFYHNGSGRYDAMLWRGSPSSSQIWKRRYGSGTSGGVDDNCRAVVAMKGGFLAVGKKGMSPGKHVGKTWLFAVDDSASGKLLWEKTWGQATGNNATSIRRAPAGGWIVGGMRAPTAGAAQQAWLWHIDDKGESLWSRLHSGGSHGQLGPITLLADGGILAPMEAGSPTKWSHEMLRTDQWGHVSCKDAGACANPKLPGCDDGKPCNYDFCDAKSGCKSSGVQPDGAPCDDGSPCTIRTTCASNQCKGGLPALGAIGGSKGHTVALGDAHELEGGDIFWTGDRYFDSSNKSDAWLLRTDASGKEKISKPIICGVNNHIRRSVRLSSGAIATVGLCEQGSVLTTGKYHMWAGMFTTSGTTSWQLSMHVSVGLGTLQGLVERPDGVIAAVGSFWFPGKGNGAVVLFDGKGSTLEYKLSNTTKDSSLEDVALGANGTVIAVGRDISAGSGSYDGWIYATDDKAKPVWQKHHGGVASDGLYRIARVKDGHVAFGRRSKAVGVPQDPWLLAFDSKGAKQWEQTFGVHVLSGRMGLQALSGGDLLLVSSSSTKAKPSPVGFLLRTNASGQLLGMRKMAQPKEPGTGKTMALRLAGVYVLGDGRLALSGGAKIGRSAYPWRALTDLWGNAICHKDCAAASWSKCDDGLPCTLDTCAAATGKCAHQPSPAASCP